ncbi:Cas1p-domain-containing protein [Rickenella mellea]|uniref:Cas1p-domain-containing protein n=1 Tax=Rickenella mellea TaxID=50990 RepID=A0A4Y7QMQ9_9AGAM|nr:Cas1p-domain-containing protein [Rickenella mellea]
MAFRLNPRWPHFLAYFLLILSLLLGFIRILFFDYSDPLHCRSLAHSGQWSDSNHRNWQPQGCMLHTYTPDDVSTCLSHRQLNFIGDSFVRHLFSSVANIAHPEFPASLPNNGQSHTNHLLTTPYGTNLSFIWDPYLNTSFTDTILTKPHTRPPSLIVLGSGLWFLRYTTTSGGLELWERTIEKHLSNIAFVRPKPADAIVFLPVPEVVSDTLPRDGAVTFHDSEIHAMNAHLAYRVNTLESFALPLDPSPLPLITVPVVLNRMVGKSETTDGIHFSRDTRKAQANVLLNMLCNDRLPKRFPFDKTCCSKYPMPSLPQIFVIATFVLMAPFLWLCMQFRLIAPWSPSSHTIYGAFLTIALANGVLFLSDRTGLWLKEQKQYNPWYLGFLVICILTVGLTTLRRVEYDLGILNRKQTDEWKGWMQLIILVYHYFKASQVSGVYNPIRILVASYLFMTGYGHTTFYLKKADYSFTRVAQILVRLNLTTVVLAYIMNTNYASYYFSPLVSLWFLIVYGTMAIGSRFNGRTAFIIVKLLISMGLVTAVMDQPWLLEELFQTLKWCCQIHWSVREAMFRIKLDMWITYGGMFTAVAVVKFRETRLGDHPNWQFVRNAGIGGAFLVLVWYFIFELTQISKFAYNLWHPYISWLPIGSIIILRNATRALRSSYSRAFEFVGRCSLEAYIIQYHFLLAADSKGVLVVIPGTRWRPLNMVITSFLFLFLCDRIARASSEITNQICNATTPTLPTTRTLNLFANGRRNGVLLGTEAEAIPTRLHNVSKDARDNGERWPESGSPILRMRWRDRLANEPLGSRTVVSWKPSVKFRILGICLAMWILNWVWPEQ